VFVSRSELDELLAAASQSVQSQEQLCFLMGKSSKLEGGPSQQGK